MGLPLIALIAVGAILLSGGGGERPTQSDARGQQDQGNGGAGSADLGTPSLGREDAPVVLTEYSDYQ